MKHYTENELDRDMKALQEEVPPMPENLHQRWAGRIAQEPQTASLPARKPLRTYITRGIAAAAAALFIVTGASVTSDRTPMTTGGLTAADYSVSRAYDSTSGKAMMYGRTMSAPGSNSVAQDGVMLTSGSAEAAVQERKIIRSVSLSISAEAFSDALSSIKSACEATGGWIESISESGEAGDRYAWMTLRIPADQLNLFLENAGGAGRITNRSESAQDVTDSYYDTLSRLESQQTLMNRLRELVAMAETLEDVLALESQIADTQYQIDRLQESLLRTDRQVDYATVDISLREATPADQAADTELSFAERIAAAFKTGGEVFTTFIEESAVWLVSATPFAGVVAAIWLVWRIIRRKRK